MSNFTQQQFLGASIRYFNINLGWGNEESILEVGLVEDPKLDEHFEPVRPGSLGRFQYDEWIFDGIINNYKIRRDQSGNRVIDVTMTDPRKILSGVQLILNGYNDQTYGIRNIYNVFGYLENIAYGYSGVSDAGIPAGKIVEALNVLLIQSPIVFQDAQYNFQLYNLPPINPYYRINGSNISFMDFINDICETSNLDYFIYAQGNTILLKWISRNQRYQFGAIDRYVNTTFPTPVSIDQGLELEMNTSTKFLIGGQVEEMLFVHSNINELDYNPAQVEGIDAFNDPRLEKEDFYNNTYYNVYAENNIWPYWGLKKEGDSNSSAVLGQGMGVAHKMILDGSSIKYPMVDFSDGYPSSVMEMYHAGLSQHNWEVYLNTGRVIDDPNNMSYKKATRLGFPATISEKFCDLIFNDVNKAKRILAKDQININDFIDIEEKRLELFARVYNYISNIAREYLGRKFMIRVPNLLAKIDPDTLELKTSLEPTDGGYLEPAMENIAVAQKTMPVYKDFVKDSNGKITAYCRFDGWIDGNLDVSDLSSDDFIIEGDSVFVKCEVDPKVVFLDRATLTSPRVVITLPGRVFTSKIGGTVAVSNNIIAQAFKDKTGVDLARLFNGVVGQNVLNDGIITTVALPSFVAVPLKNNYRTYGPWFSSLGVTGNVEVEKNEELVPWNFGNMDTLNKAGLSLASEIYANQFYNETGSVTIPGVPIIGLGAPITSDGPLITSINVRHDATDGVVTTYSMKKWSQQLGKLNRQNIEQYKKIYKITSEQRRSLQKLYKSQRPLSNAVNKGQRDNLKHALTRPQSPHHVLCGEVVKQGDYYVPVVVSSPLKEVPLFLESGSIYNRSICGFDAVLYPFSVSGNNVSKLPTILQPGYSGTYRKTGRSLNLYSGVNNVSLYLNGMSGVSGAYTHTDINNDFLSGDLSKINPPAARGLGLRAPVYMVEQDYNGTFKAGPLDAQFDVNRQVWTADAPSVGLAYIISGVDANSTGTAMLMGTNLDTEVYHNQRDRYNASNAKNLFGSKGELVIVANLDLTSLADRQIVQIKRCGGYWLIDYVYCDVFIV